MGQVRNWSYVIVQIDWACVHQCIDMDTLGSIFRKFQCGKDYIDVLLHANSCSSNQFTIVSAKRTKHAKDRITRSNLKDDLQKVYSTIHGD